MKRIRIKGHAPRNYYQGDRTQGCWKPHCECGWLAFSACNYRTQASDQHQEHLDRVRNGTDKHWNFIQKLYPPERGE
jgi:hypothetical protein